jgi:hypothetical protein
MRKKWLHKKWEKIISMNPHTSILHLFFRNWLLCFLKNGQKSVDTIRTIKINKKQATHKKFKSVQIPKLLANDAKVAKIIIPVPVCTLMLKNLHRPSLPPISSFALKSCQRKVCVKETVYSYSLCELAQFVQFGVAQDLCRIRK